VLSHSKSACISLACQQAAASVVFKATSGDDIATITSEIFVFFLTSISFKDFARLDALGIAVYIIRSL